MKLIKTTLFSLLIGIVQIHLTNAQTLAVTEHGDTIYVYSNGTWSFEYLEEAPLYKELGFLDEILILDTLSEAFSVPKNASKEIKNMQGQFIIKYDDKLWKRVPPASLNDDAEFAFVCKKSEIWCVVISEETIIDADNLFKIAKNTMMENTGSEPLVLKTELRNVNGSSVIRGTLNANFSGISFIFDSYYYSNDLGSVQFIVWTSDKVWAKNKEMIHDLLNGFVVTGR